MTRQCEGFECPARAVATAVDDDDDGDHPIHLCAEHLALYAQAMAVYGAAAHVSNLDLGGDA